MLENVDMFKNFYVLHERAQGLQTLTVVKFDEPGGKGIKFPEPSYTLGSENNRKWDTDKFRYRYTSFITPNSVFDYDAVQARATARVLFGFPNPAGVVRINDTPSSPRRCP